jgi:hypothetical protein
VDAVALSADAVASWHGAWLDALDLRWERTGTVWRALDPPPFIYLTLITLVPDVDIDEFRDAHGTVCDTWGSLDLTALEFEEHDRDAFVERAHEPLFVRVPGPLHEHAAPAELEIIEVSTPDQVLEFERVSMRGFRGDETAVDPGSLHPPAILANPRMRMLTGRVEGSAVAAAMSYRTDEVIGIYGVTTVEQARGRGYATTLTLALIDPALPATLSPSPEAENLYRRLGFGFEGRLRQWQRRSANDG